MRITLELDLDQILAEATQLLTAVALLQRMRPAVRRELAGHLQVTYGISERRACCTTGFGRSSQRYRKRRDR